MRKRAVTNCNVCFELGGGAVVLHNCKAYPEVSQWATNSVSKNVLSGKGHHVFILFFRSKAEVDLKDLLRNLTCINSSSVGCWESPGTGVKHWQAGPSTQFPQTVQPQSEVPMELGQGTFLRNWSSSQRKRPIPNRLRHRRGWIPAVGLVNPLSEQLGVAELSQKSGKPEWVKCNIFRPNCL